MFHPQLPPLPPSLADSEKVSVGVKAAAALCETWALLFFYYFFFLPLALSAGFPCINVTRTHALVLIS